MYSFFLNFDQPLLICELTNTFGDIFFLSFLLTTIYIQITAQRLLNKGAIKKTFMKMWKRQKTKDNDDK